jgi:hypothetical protein
MASALPAPLRLTAAVLTVQMSAREYIAAVAQTESAVVAKRNIHRLSAQTRTARRRPKGLSVSRVQTQSAKRHMLSSALTRNARRQRLSARTLTVKRQSRLLARPRLFALTPIAKRPSRLLARAAKRRPRLTVRPHLPFAPTRTAKRQRPCPLGAKKRPLFVTPRAPALTRTVKRQRLSLLDA